MEYARVKDYALLRAATKLQNGTFLVSCGSIFFKKRLCRKTTYSYHWWNEPNIKLTGSRACAVVRALVLRHCGLGSIPGFYAICGLSLLVLCSSRRGFSPGTPVFPSPQKPTFAGVAQLASVRLSEQGVPSSILGDFNVCFDFL